MVSGATQKIAQPDLLAKGSKTFAALKTKRWVNPTQTF